MSLLELQARFLIITEYSDFQMYVIIAGTFLHILWNYLTVNVWGLGIVGTGIATSITNLTIFIAMVIVTSLQDRLKEANEVSF